MCFCYLCQIHIVTNKQDLLICIFTTLFKMPKEKYFTKENNLEKGSLEVNAM